MFYSETILAKKGALAKVWLAAHWDKKLSKAQIYSANIQASVGRFCGNLRDFSLLFLDQNYLNFYP